MLIESDENAMDISTDCVNCVFVFVYLAPSLFISLAALMCRNFFSGNSTCQVRDSCDKSNTSVIDCVFPVSISLFHASISKEPGEPVDFFSSR